MMKIFESITNMTDLNALRSIYEKIRDLHYSDNHDVHDRLTNSFVNTHVG